MLKKRLVGMVTVRNGWAVQSFGYRRYLPLGRPECLVENLDRWGADEILVQSIDRTARGLGPDFELIDRLARLGLGTPLIYGGGIGTVQDGVQVIQRGADRITVDAMFQSNLPVVDELSDRLGAQAVIASLPVSANGPELALFDYRRREKGALSARQREMIERSTVSEVLVTDWLHEGMPGAFDVATVDAFPCRDAQLIAFGGISTAVQIQSLLARPQVVAVAIGNFLSYKEHAVQQFRNSLASTALRPATYAAEYPLIRDV
jgi:cyclase